MILITVTIFLWNFKNIYNSRDNLVVIATGYGPDDRGFFPDRGKIFFSSSQRPDRLWGPVSTGDSFAGGEGGEADQSPPSRSRTVELCLHFSIRLHGVVLE
jgi:hypothetical protein